MCSLHRPPAPPCARYALLAPWLAALLEQGLTMHLHTPLLRGSGSAERSMAKAPAAGAARAPLCCSRTGKGRETLLGADIGDTGPATLRQLAGWLLLSVCSIVKCTLAQACMSQNA